MTIGIGALIGLFVVALLLGFAAQVLGEFHRSWEWLVTGAAALVGGFVAGQYLGPATTWGIRWDGLWLLPALLGMLVLAGAVDWIVRGSAQET